MPASLRLLCYRHALLSAVTLPIHSTKERSLCKCSTPAHSLAVCCQSRALEQEDRGWLCGQWAAMVLEYGRSHNRGDICLQFSLADGDHGLPVVVDEERHVAQLGASLDAGQQEAIHPRGLIGHPPGCLGG